MIAIVRTDPVRAEPARSRSCCCSCSAAALLRDDPAAAEAAPRRSRRWRRRRGRATRSSPRPGSSARSSTIDDDDGTMTVEIAPGTEIRMMRAAIGRLLTEATRTTTTRTTSRRGRHDDDGRTRSATGDRHVRAVARERGSSAIRAPTASGRPAPSRRRHPRGRPAATRSSRSTSPPPTGSWRRWASPSTASATRTSSRASPIRSCTGWGTPSARRRWRASPGTCTTSGNALARDAHGQTGASSPTKRSATA